MLDRLITGLQGVCRGRNRPLQPQHQESPAPLIFEMSTQVYECLESFGHSLISQYYAELTWTGNDLLDNVFSSWNSSHTPDRSNLDIGLKGKTYTNELGVRVDTLLPWPFLRLEFQGQKTKSNDYPYTTTYTLDDFAVADSDVIFAGRIGYQPTFKRIENGIMGGYFLPPLHRECTETKRIGQGKDALWHQVQEDYVRCEIPRPIMAEVGSEGNFIAFTESCDRVQVFGVSKRGDTLVYHDIAATSEGKSITVPDLKVSIEKHNRDPFHIHYSTHVTNHADGIS